MEFTNILAILFGGLAGAIASQFFLFWRTRQEYRSLILSFCAEFVLLFDRCVIYLDQRVDKNKVSFSSLFSFTDSSAFSKFASVTKNPEVAACIIELKASYFQIQRHAEEASKYAVDANIEPDEKLRNEIMAKAHHAQGRALAFFDHFHNDIERYTDLIVHEAKHLLPKTSHEIWKLSSQFSDAKNKYRELKRRCKQAS